ncbi:hypothetical protein [Enterobacter cloacae]|uniref:hypothetical protein n=1 Tax=Enterobacter cloacae TaxID=550 RepID=UPI000B8DB32B|nr:hypothetical protein [Enterobacter cloacae]ASQ19464.1 hypothetical protein BJM06_03708 [Enterobacter cloacae]RTO58544.1 hypothetical protein EKN65_14310 [Enterobacter cloacae]
MRLPLFLYCFAVLIFSHKTVASSEHSWKKVFIELNIACLEAAKVSVAVTSDPVIFPDQSGMIGLLMLPETHQDTRKAGLMCIYDKRIKQAYVSEYRLDSGW